MSTRMKVTPKSHRSTDTRLAMDTRHLSLVTARALGEGLHDFLEYSSTVFVAFELIETRAGRSQQDDVSGSRSRRRFTNGVLERRTGNDGDNAGNLLFDLLRGCADGVDLFHSLTQQ